MLAFTEDDWVQELQERRQPIWVATLSDGRRVYQDDGRPGVSVASAWLRLRQFVAENDLALTGLGLRFRSHHHDHILPAHAAGYYFSKVAAASAFAESQETFSFYLVGHADDTTVHLHRWQVPELILFESFARPLDLKSEALIWAGKPGRLMRPI